MKYHIEKNTVQETLIIPLYARKVCSEHYPQLFQDESATRICDMLDYDFDSQKKKMESAIGLFGALEVAQRQYDLQWEVTDYLKSHPKAAVVNLGCGLDDTFSRVDNGSCRGYNIDMPDVIAVRNELLPAGEREQNAFCAPLWVILACFWIPMLVVQFKAFSKGLTPYPGSAKWFNLFVGAIPALVIGFVFGADNALGSGIGTTFLSVGNAFTFGGLLATLPSDTAFMEFREKISSKRMR